MLGEQLMMKLYNKLKVCSLYSSFIVFSFSGALKIIFRTRGGGGRGTLFRLSEQYCNEVPYILGGSDWEIKE